MAKEKIKEAEDNEVQEEKKLTKKEKLTSAKKKFRKKLRRRVLKISLLIVVLFLINIYVILGILYKYGGFTISLDYEEGRDSSLLIYESPEDKTQKTYLRCDDIDFFSDVSINWIPDEIHNEADGSHHGLHYMAYTFYVENIGDEPVHYWETAVIDNQEKGVDEALRFMVYRNDEEKRVYGKLATNGSAEPGTTPFKDETTIMLEQRKAIMPGETDKYTIVIFLEGDDPQCINNILGGEIELHMTITEEHITDPKEMEAILKNNSSEENNNEGNNTENSTN